MYLRFKDKKSIYIEVYSYYFAGSNIVLSKTSCMEKNIFIYISTLGIDYVRPCTVS